MENVQAPSPQVANKEFSFTVGFKDLNGKELNGLIHFYTYFKYLTATNVTKSFKHLWSKIKYRKKNCFAGAVVCLCVSV